MSGFTCVEKAVTTLLSANPEMRCCIRGIGVCAPGPLDPIAGIVLNLPNLPCWRDFHLAEAVQNAFGLPTRVDNDANAGALAEAIWGSAVGYRDVFYATLGTGIGTGIVFDGQIYHGSHRRGCGRWAMSIDYRGPHFACGKRGCIEAFCSGPAIAYYARTLLEEQRGVYSKRELAGGDLRRVTGETVAEAFRQGDALALEVLKDRVSLLTVWFGNIIDLLEPQVIIVGGGLSGLMRSFLNEIDDQLSAWSVNSRCREIPILQAKYGSEAGIAGAASLCMS